MNSSPRSSDRPVLENQTVCLKKLKTAVLFERTKKLVAVERRIGLAILECLHEIEKRRAYAELKYDGLFTYCVKELGFTDSQAYQRIQAMRVLNEIPELAQKIEDGSLSVSTIAKAQNHFRKEKKLGRAVMKDQKVELFGLLENKTSREVEKTLAEIRGEEFCEKLVLELTPELKALWDHAKNLSAHRSKGEDSEVLKILLTEWLNRNDPILKAAAKDEKRKASQDPFNANAAPATARGTDHTEVQESVQESVQKPTQKPVQTPAPEKPQDPLERPNHPKNKASSDDSRRGVPSPIQVDCEQSPRSPSASVRRAVWIRDRGKCNRCESRHSLEIDHIRPYACGGKTTIENLRMLCRSCNLFLAQKTFGDAAVPRSTERR